MSRPFNRRQAHENDAFLAALRRTGNTREAARSLGIHRGTMFKRRARDAAFAAEWDAALALAHARLNAGTPAETPEGEPHVIRTASGRLQLRRARPRRLDRQAEQAFLAALSATANVRLSAAAAGFSHSAFYLRRRESPAFAREMRLALEMGYERLELALLEAADPENYRDDAWRRNDPPPIPQMSAGEALQLLHLHQKEVRLQAEPPHIKRRRGESSEAHRLRLSAMYEARLQRDREAFDIAEAERRARGEPHLFGPKELSLPALDQVKGWSKADPAKRPQDRERPMFGGWRIGDWKKG
ncbi:hypothetical protein [Sphingomonas sp.]|uniref:hypothetical protein n=1 Tax=Sphingomonas sp. TaxID=28214 RepID=UPI0031D629C7